MLLLLVGDDAVERVVVRGNDALHRVGQAVGRVVEERLDVAEMIGQRVLQLRGIDLRERVVVRVRVDAEIAQHADGRRSC